MSIAICTKAHHAGMDGQAGIAVAQAVFDLQATGPERDSPAKANKPATSPSEKK